MTAATATNESCRSKRSAGEGTKVVDTLSYGTFSNEKGQLNHLRRTKCGAALMVALVIAGSLVLIVGGSSPTDRAETYRTQLIQGQGKCGCAAAVLNTGISAESCDSSTADFCGNCDGDYACPNGLCPFAGVARDGMCLEEGGTHKVCSVVSESLQDWFISVGNDLSSVVTDGGGWCLCKHWTRGALCCHQDTALLEPGSFDWSASDLSDPEVMQIQEYIRNPSDDNFCAMCSYDVEGCTEQLPIILKQRGCTASSSSISISNTPHDVAVNVVAEDQVA